MTSVTISKGMTSIGASAFYGCTALATVYCRAVTPPTLNINLPFNEIPTPPTIYVPSASTYAYRTAGGWSYYLDYIEGYDF